MRINLFGAGYVGLVTAACLAEHGNQVLCCDVDQEKIKRLQQGECPIHEPDLPALLKKTLMQDDLALVQIRNKELTMVFINLLP